MKRVKLKDIVRVDESGIAVIAGTAEPSTTIEAKIGNQTVGTTEVNKDEDFLLVERFLFH